MGQTIDMIRQLGDTTQELRLYDSADRLLMTPNRNTRGFGVSNQSDADSVLDNMMNSLQSGALGLYPMSLSFGGKAGELRLKVVAAGVIVQGDTDGDGQADFATTLAGAFGVEVGAFLLVCGVTGQEPRCNVG